jgi:ankyrin repeat protein
MKADVVAERVPGFVGHGERNAPRLSKDTARYGLARCIETLVALGADINAQNTEKETALFRAANLGHERAVVVLVKLGADPRVRNREGHRAIDRARDKGFVSIVNALRAMLPERLAAGRWALAEGCGNGGEQQS